MIRLSGTGPGYGKRDMGLSGLMQLLRNKSIIIRFLIKHVFISP